MDELVEPEEPVEPDDPVEPVEADEPVELELGVVLLTPATVLMLHELLELAREAFAEAIASCRPELNGHPLAFPEKAGKTLV